MNANSSPSTAAFANPVPFLSSSFLSLSLALEWQSTFLWPFFPHFQHSPSIFALLGVPLHVWGFPRPFVAASAFSLALSWRSSMASHSNSSISVLTIWSGSSLALACAADIVIALIRGRYDLGSDPRMTVITVKGLSWEYDIFSHTCDCSRVVSGGRYFRFRFGFGTVFSFRWCNWLFRFEFEFVIVSVVSQLHLFVRENLLGRQSSVWMSEIIKSV